MTSTPMSIAHVALTVTDLGRSVPWYTDLFGAPVLEGTFCEGTRHEYQAAVWLEPSLAIHAFADPVREAHDVRRPGLDHVSFSCSDLDELAGWSRRLDDLGIPHGEILTEWYGSGLSFSDPDGIPLELFVLGRAS